MMTKKELLAIWRKYKSIGNEFYINDSYIYIINSWEYETYKYQEDEKPIRITEQRLNDYLVRMSNTKSIWSGLGFRVYEKLIQQKNGKWKKETVVDEYEAKDILKKLKQCENIVYANTKMSVHFPKKVMKVIKNSITEYSPTHIQFSARENNKLKLRMFDIKRFVQQEFDDFGYADLDLNVSFNDEFSIRKEVFEKLSIKDYDIRLLEQDIVCFDDNGSELYVRVQELLSPIIEFETTTREHISLLLQPTISPT
jgi:hypothetical protein